jgi:hypothetical protein
MQLTETGLAVVIGAMPGNLRPEHRNHPRILRMTSKEASRHALPQHAEAVLTTRFVSHKQILNVIQEAKTRGLSIWHQITTHRLKEILDELLGTPPLDQAANAVAVATTPDPTPAPEAPLTPAAPEDHDMSRPTRIRAPRGTVSAYVRKHADFTADIPSFEVDRLLGELRSQGLHATRKGVQSAFYKWRRIGTAAGLNPRPIAPAQAPPNGMAEVLAMLDDAIAALTLARERVASLPDPHQQIRDALQSFLGQLKG